MTIRCAGLVAMLAAGGASAAPCPPRAALAGDPAAIARVTAELVRLGVAVSAGDAATPRDACRVVTAALALDPERRIAVEVRGGAQRERRVMRDAAVAAAWIDAWVRDDFAAPPPDFVPPPSELAGRGAGAEARAAAGAPHRGFAASATFDQAWTLDRTRWTAITIAGCARFGALCLGARGRYARQDVLAAQTAAARSDLSLLATASRASDLGHLVIAPELALGVGRLTTERIDGCRRLPSCDPGDPRCVLPVQDATCVRDDPEHAYTLYVHDGFRATSVTPRAAAGLRLAVPLGGALWLDGFAGAMLSPFGHTGSYALPTASATPFGVPRDQLALPGDPLATFELGLGLRIGGL